VPGAGGTGLDLPQGVGWRRIARDGSRLVETPVNLKATPPAWAAGPKLPKHTEGGVAARLRVRAPEQGHQAPARKVRAAGSIAGRRYIALRIESGRWCGRSPVNSAAGIAGRRWRPAGLTSLAGSDTTGSASFGVAQPLEKTAGTTLVGHLESPGDHRHFVRQPSTIGKRGAGRRTDFAQGMYYRRSTCRHSHNRRLPGLEQLDQRRHRFRRRRTDTPTGIRAAAICTPYPGRVTNR